MSTDSKIGAAVAYLQATADGMTKAVAELKLEIREHSKQSTEQVIAVDRLARDVERIQQDIGSATKSLAALEGRVDKLEDTLDPKEYAEERRRGREELAKQREADAAEKHSRAGMWKAITAAIGGGGLLGWLAKLLSDG